MRKVLLLVGILFSISTLAQKFEPFAELMEPAPTSFPQRIGFMDGDALSIYGAFSEMKLYANTFNLQEVEIKNLNNTVRYKDGLWINPGDVLIPKEYSVKKHFFVGTDEYINCGVIPYVRELNRTTNAYDITPFAVNGNVTQLAAWGNDNLLIGGNFSKVDNQSFINVVLKTPSGLVHTQKESGENDLESPLYYLYSSGDILFGVSDFQFVYTLKKGETIWKNTFPDLPAFHAFLGFAGDKDLLYILLDTGEGYVVYKSVEGAAWKEIISLESQTYDPFKDQPIKGFTSYAGNLYIGGSFDEVNGVESNGIVVYNEASGTVKDVVTSLPATIKSDQCVGLYVFGDNLYMPIYGSRADWTKGHTVFVLRNVSTVPMRFLSFAVEVKNNTAFLTWKVAEQESCKDFVVEHRNDGTTFQEVGNMVSVTGKDDYSFSLPLQTGDHFLRITARGKDGQMFFSETRKVSIFGKVIIFPNPASTYLFVYLPEAEKITFFDVAGRKAKEYFAVKGSNRITIGNLSKGMYFIKGKAFYEKIVIQ